MTLDKAKEICPALFSKIKQDIFSDRDLIIVDDNYEEEDGEEVGELNPNEYNYYIYVPDASIEVIGSSGLESFATDLEGYETIDSFVTIEEDLFGVKSDLDEDALIETCLRVLESLAS